MQKTACTDKAVATSSGNQRFQLPLAPLQQLLLVAGGAVSATHILSGDQVQKLSVEKTPVVKTEKAPVVHVTLHPLYMPTSIKNANSWGEQKGLMSNKKDSRRSPGFFSKEKSTRNFLVEMHQQMGELNVKLTDDVCSDHTRLVIPCMNVQSMLSLSKLYY